MSTTRQKNCLSQNPSSPRGGTVSTARMNEFLCETIKRAREELSAGNYQGVVNITNVIINNYMSNNINNSSNNSSMSQSHSSSFTELNINDETGINSLQLSRAYILQCEAFFKMGDNKSALRAAEQGAKYSKYQNPHTMFVLGRQLIQLGRVMESIDAFENGENLILSGISESPMQQGCSYVGECWASLGFDPLYAPTNVMPPDDIDNIVNTSDDDGDDDDNKNATDISPSPEIVGSDPTECEQLYEDQQSGTTTDSVLCKKDKYSISRNNRINNDNYVNECCILHYSTVTSTHLLSQPHVRDWSKELRRLLGFRDDAIIMASLLKNRTIPISNGNNFLTNFTMEKRPNCAKEYVIKIRNYAETPLVHFYERISSGIFADDLPLPNVIRGGEQGITAMEGTKWKRFTTIMCYSFRGTTQQQQNLHCNNTEKKVYPSVLGRTGVVSEDGALAVMLWVEAPLVYGPLRAGVRVEPLYNLDRLRFLDLVKNAEIDESSKYVSLSTLGTSSKTQYYNKCIFVPIVYFSHGGDHYKLITEHESDRTQMFSLVKMRDAVGYVRVPVLNNNSLNASAQNVTYQMQSFNRLLNDVELLSVFEYVPSDHRYKVAMVSRKCRRLMNSLPPTGSYGTRSCQCTYPSYAIKEDFFDSPWTVRDLGTTTLKVLCDGPVTLLVDKNKNTIFSFVINDISSNLVHEVFFGVGRKALVMKIEESWSMFFQKKVKVKAASSDAPDIGTITILSDDTFTFSPCSACFISERKVYPSVALYTVKRRMCGGLLKHQLDEVLISFFSDSVTNTCNTAIFTRSNTSSKNSTGYPSGLEVGELTVCQGTDLLMVFTLMAYCREISLAT